MEIDTLQKLGNDELFAAYQEAFAEYEIQLNKNELFRMLKRRGYNPDLSYGAFDQARLVSFTFNGIGWYNGLMTAYDILTGTIPEYRGKGLAQVVFKHAEKGLKAASVKQYLLEVLQHNAPAVNLYRKLGFEISRSFNYYHQDASQIPDNLQALDTSNKITNLPLDMIPEYDFSDFSSSWQNSHNAIKRSPEDFSSLGFIDKDVLMGFIVMDPKTGDLTQIQVHPGHRRKGIGTALVLRAVEINQHEEIKLINSDSRDMGMTKFMESLNIPLRGKQYEMIKPF